MSCWNNGVIECDCGECYVYPYEHEIISNENGTLRIAWKGQCPYCQKEYYWTSVYSFLEMTYHTV